jgi:hypothetical protein
MLKLKMISYFLIVIILLSGCVNKKTTQLQDENQQLKKEISQYKLQISNLEEQLNITKPVNSEKNCEFTRTYQIIKILNNYQDTVNEVKYVVIDEFQSSKPYLVGIPINMIDEINENKTYEFTFTGKERSSFNQDNLTLLFENYDVKNIKYTNKTGLEQIQEPIECH